MGKKSVASEAANNHDTVNSKNKCSESVRLIAKNIKKSLECSIW
jgi:hypothetical protein